jgi:molecular chaperone Hsp33
LEYFLNFDKNTPARKAHDLSPIAAAVLGRLMTGTVMMGSFLAMAFKWNLPTVHLSDD